MGIATFQAFDFNKEAMEAFNNDSQAYKKFNGDIKAYRAYREKIIKFELLVEEINRELLSRNFVYSLGRFIDEATRRNAKNFLGVHDKVSPLNLIFSNQNENCYMKVILSKVGFNLEIWFEKYRNKDLNNLNTKIVATKDLVKELRETTNRKEALEFIFWSLFALTVDKNDYEENASLIADFAYMIKIDDKTMRDIIKVIKVSFGEKKQVDFETDEVPEVFSKVLDLYKN